MRHESIYWLDNILHIGKLLNIYGLYFIFPFLIIAVIEKKDVIYLKVLVFWGYWIEHQYEIKRGATIWIHAKVFWWKLRIIVLNTASAHTQKYKLFRLYSNKTTTREKKIRGVHTENLALLNAKLVYWVTDMKPTLPSTKEMFY